MKKAQLFTKIKVKTPRSNMFDLSHDVKQSMRMGNLSPCMVMDCVPGDKVQLGCSNMVRFAPMLAPIMHKVDVYIHYFFVPNRIIWPNWEKYITNQETGGLPTLTLANNLSFAQAKFGTFFGLPMYDPAVDNPQSTVSALPIAAYQKIYTDYYRDQNLVTDFLFGIGEGDSLDPDNNLQYLADGDNDFARNILWAHRRRAWEHDYFTSALPFAQKGDQVDIPLGDVVLKDDWDDDGLPGFVDDLGNRNPAGGAVEQQDVSPSDGSLTVGGAGPMAYDPDGTLTTQATTINDLRRAIRLQEWLEKNARGGTRYIELIYSHFGVRSSDKRLQRPEYITGTKNPVIISEVLNTTGQVSAEEGALPQGNMAGHGVSVGSGYKGSYFCEEHGYIIGIASITPRTAYQQGIPRHFLKRDPLEIFWPSFAHLGEQEIINDELFMPLSGGPNGGVFGYIPRYSEYKYIPSRVAGDFMTSLNYWHLGRIFANAPSLNKQFIEIDPNTDIERIFAAGATEDYLWCHFAHRIKARRPMPVFGTPML